MNLQQDQLKAFYEVAKIGSFTKAADNLGITQSALSQRIKNLENFLETTLFIRATDGIRLTEAGDKLLKYARVQNQIESEFITDLKSKPNQGLSGALRMGGASSLMWSVGVPALSKFLRSNPNVNVEMSANEISELPNLLQSGQFDFIITCGKINRYAYEEIFLGYEINVLVESKKFDHIPDVYLDHHPEDRTSIEYLKLNNTDASKINRSYFDNINGIIAAIEAGLGKAVIPIHLLNEHKSLHTVKGERKLKVPVYLCYLKQPFYSKLHTEIIEVVKREVSKVLGG